MVRSYRQFRCKLISGKQSLLRYAVISGILLLTALLTIILSSNILLLIPVALIGLAGLVLLIHFPEIGIIVILLAGFFIPFTGPGGFNGSVIGIAFLLSLWIFTMIVKNRKIKIVYSRTILPLFCAIC